jgi:hypothetical protein
VRGRPNDPIPDDDAQAERWCRELAERGLDAILDERERATRDYRLLLEYLRERARLSDEDAARYLRAVEAASADELIHLDLVMVARHLGQPLTSADSFFRSMLTRRRKKQLGHVPERLLGISKEFDEMFARALGVRTPKIRFVGPFRDIPTVDRVGTFLKPMKSSGAKGAFYLFAEDRIRSAQHHVTLTEWSDMIEMIEEEFGSSFLYDAPWQVQELIRGPDSSPARDVKFYAFYGEIGLIQEVSRHEDRLVQYFDPDGSVADCGQRHQPFFTDPSATTVDKGGLPESALAEVRELSRSIPAPFMRIDYLLGERDLVFLEMTSAPGNLHTFNDEYDRRLGQLYNEAEIRLTNDLLDGKRFDGYQRFLREHSERGRPRRRSRWRGSSR